MLFRPPADSRRFAIEQHLIDGRYTVIERIGKGAMGVVYKAHDTVLDREVAIKQMAAEIDDDPLLRARFTQEARSAARLNHRNIITIFELHESETDIYIVMELLEGVDLAALIKRQTTLPIEAKLNMMAQVCDGLEYAHKKGIIHRDIKPANLHVSPAGVVKILDFGIARLAASKMTSTGGLIGTPDYMSPEQVMAGSLDARSDLFAVGAVTYELLSGSKPFEAESVTALLMKIARDPHVPLRQRAPHVPAGAIDLVERLLAKNPDDRPSSAREVQEALLAIASDRSPLDANTVAILASAVTEETLRPRTPRPPTRPPRPATVPPAAAGSGSRPGAARGEDSSSKLASLAIERGRVLREAGDLGGAMKVFRSVLEIAPGNAEAMRELEEMERAFARITASGRPSAEAPVAAPIATADTIPRRLEPPAPPPPREPVAPPAPLPPSPVVGSAGAGVTASLGLIAAGVIVVVLLGGAGLYMWSTRQDERVDDRAATTSTVLTSTTSVPQIVEASPATTSAAAAAPAVAVAPPPTTSVAAPPPPPPPAATSAPDRRLAERITTTTSIAAQRVEPPPPEPAPAAAPATAPGPPPTASAAPPAAPANPPPAAPSAPSNGAVVKHFHARVLFRGGGACEGVLEFQPDGIRFRTTAPGSDGRKDDKKIPFKEIEDFEIDGDRIVIETDDKNWTFGAPKDVLQRIEQYIKTNKKDS